MEERVGYIQDFINKENTSTGYEYDRYMEYRSSNFSSVITEGSGNKEECIMSCVNHYLGLNIMIYLKL
ncbi:hypothetical protein Curi_c07900 [Gottschalkia acidurici 9a]|uniref:Uncharacterized protein n=1 Tax=Gottschalkia acidurici (strain ATCC 7906 / DSM 604 / BCRC 14475 / CIP 104303 / KCTC 5404 / NCIMB 10678 / 9a) TaxID=1128398 RepID=K0AVJ4_GOTA9|nr:hypothetical protein Curi_c07900 [Gottschalkia acidurici 9a]